jgi:hypothetical protein
MKRVLLIGVALVLAGCATGYQTMGFTGGFEEIKLSQDTYRISVSGNGFTSRSRAENIALLRAAELTIQDGYERFAVLGGRVSQEFSGTTNITVNRIGNTAIASGGDPIFKPGGDLVIRMVAKGDPAFATALDAQLIQSQLRPKLTS